MNAIDLLTELRQRGVELRPDGARLLYRPKEAVTPELVEAMRGRKAELLALLSREAQAELAQEREAIHADGNMPMSAGDDEPSRWSRLADSGLGHNDVVDHAEVIFLFAHELIQDPDRGQFPGDLPRTWGHYAPFWKERLPQEAFEELERIYRQRLAALGLREEARPPQGPQTLRPLALNPEGTGCADCGGREYWVAKGGARFCLACHPAFYRDAIAIGAIRQAEPAEEEPAPLVVHARPVWQRADGSCFACGSRESWRSIHGVVTCTVCHPPASPDLVDEWTEGETE